jgi:hypothetical protein
MFQVSGLQIMVALSSLKRNVQMTLDKKRYLKVKTENLNVNYFIELFIKVDRLFCYLF